MSATRPISTTRPAYITATPVRGLGDHAHVVGDEHEGGAVRVAQAADEGNDLRLDGDVEGGGRFVGDDEFGFGAQRQRDHDTLALSARKLVGIAA